MKPEIETLYLALLTELKKALPEGYSPISDMTFATFGAIKKAIEDAEAKPDEVRQAIEIVKSGRLGPKGLVALGIAASTAPSSWPKNLWQQLDDIDRRLRATDPMGLSSIGHIVYTLIWGYGMRPSTKGP